MAAVPDSAEPEKQDITKAGMRLQLGLLVHQAHQVYCCTSLLIGDPAAFLEVGNSDGRQKEQEQDGRQKEADFSSFVAMLN